MYETELKEIGLTENEIKVYLVLLENGQLNPTKIAEKTGMHRSYIYDTLERLLEKGIINTLYINKKKHYQPVDPSILKEILELKLRQVETILPQLHGLFKATKKEIRVELHKGKRVYRTLINEIVTNSKENSEVLILGVNEDLIAEIEPIYIKQYFNIIKEKGIREKIIIRKGERKVNHKNLEYREISPEYLGDTTIAIYQSKVFFFILENPYHLITIESEKVANTFKKQFELMWSIAK